MSRIRSQLDSILDAAAERGASPRPASAPGVQRRLDQRGGQRNAATAGPGSAGADVERVRSQLDRLAGKLDAALRVRAQQKQQVSQAPDMSGLTAEIERMRSDMGELRQIMTSYADPAAIAENLKRYDAVHGGGFTQQDAETRFSQLAGELGAIRETVSGLANRDPQQAPDMEGIAQSIERGYAEIAARLDNRQDETGLSELGQQLAELRGVVETLPQHFPFETLDARYKEIEDAIIELAGSNPGQFGEQIGQLQSGLDEVTRALAAITGNPDETANGLERIEARIATLAKTVEELAENAQAQDPSELAGKISGAVELPDEFTGMMSRIEERLEALAQTGDAEDPSIRALSDQMQMVLAHLEQGAALSSDFHAEADGRAAPVAASMPNEQLEAIEAQISAVFARLDGMSSGSPEGAGSDEVARAIDELAARIDAMATREGAAHDGGGHESVAPGGEDGRLQGLEQQLDKIMTMMQEAPAASIDLTPITEQLNAAQQQFMDAVGRDLQNIEAQLQRLGEQGTAAEDDRLTQILDRLNALQDGIPAEQPQYARSASAAYAHSENEYTEPSAYPDTPAAEPAYHLDHVEPAPSLDTEVSEAGEPEMEDVPLEPGSGVPDLAALVRTASEKRRNSRASDHEEGDAPDYLAAARRAAQAAASEAEAERQAEKKQKKTKPAKAKAERKGIFGISRKTLMGATAAIALLALGAPTAMSWLGLGNNEPRIVESQPESPVVSAPANEELSQSDTVRAETAEPANMAPGRSDEPGNIEGMATPARVQDEAAMPQPVREPAGAPAETRALSMPSDVPAQAAEESTPAEAMELSAIPEPAEAAGNPVLRQAASDGDPRALFEIARRYTDGEGVDRDLAEAAKWYELSAQRDYAPAQYRLANFLEKGHGVDVDIDASAKWYGRAAENGNALAMHNLAVLHSSGMVGGKPDMEEAIGWFTQAADLGVKDSQVNLGIILAKGLGVDVDLVGSYKWFAVAAKGGDSDAASKRDMVANAMRPDQLEEARGQAEVWKPQELDNEANAVTAEPEWNANPAKERASLSETEIITETQKMLTKQGFDPGPADGVFGQKTRDAIIQFQTKAGLPADGNITPQLLRKLSSDSA